MKFNSFLPMVLRGFAMGAADIVPGVSGGTIALILGVYERLLASVRSGAGAVGRLIRGDIAGFVAGLRRIEWSFVIPLGAGIGAAVIGLSSLIDRLLAEQPQAMAGVFFGLVAASVIIAYKMIETYDTKVIAALIGVAIVAFFALGYQGGQVSDPNLIVYFAAGAVAICAMILPGISGSFLLLMMGMYGPVISAIHDRNFIVIAVFGFGAVTGLALFSTALSWVLDHHRDLLLAALVGLMVGSLRVLWPWPNGVGAHAEEGETVQAGALELPQSFAQALTPTLLALAAFVLVLFVSAHAGAKPNND